MMTSIGLNAGQTLGSLRCGISRTRDLAIANADGEPLSVCAVPLTDDSGSGLERMMRMGAAALSECAAGREAEKLPLILCCPASGEIEYDSEQLVRALHDWTGVIDSSAVVWVAGGHAAIGQALLHAQALFGRRGHDQCYIGAVDTMLDVARLRRLMRSTRIASDRTPDGFIPGEGACFLRVSTGASARGRTEIAGVAVDHETDAIRATGKVTGRAQTGAARRALLEAESKADEIGVVGTDVTGERHRFYEVTLATTRMKLRRVERVDLGPFLGEIGCTLGPVTLAYLTVALERGWMGRDGRGAIYLGADDASARAAVFVRRSRNG